MREQNNAKKKTRGRLWSGDGVRRDSSLTTSAQVHRCDKEGQRGEKPNGTAASRQPGWQAVYREAEETLAPVEQRFIVAQVACASKYHGVGRVRWVGVLEDARRAADGLALAWCNERTWEWFTVCKTDEDGYPWRGRVGMAALGASEESMPSSRLILHVRIVRLEGMKRPHRWSEIYTTDV